MGTKKMTKYDKVRQHLFEGKSISSIEAIDLYKATRLSSIIHTMKHRDKVEIESCTEVSSEGARYSRYWISKKYLEMEKEVDNAAAQIN